MGSDSDQILDNSQIPQVKKPALERRLTLPLLTLYGLGVTVGAGIYVLVGATAAKAGFYAPISFLLAALVVAFTGFTYSELSTRFPVSAGEVAYVRNGLNSKTLALLVGLMVVTSGVVSSATISIGAAEYLSHFITLAPEILIIIIILVLGLVAAWGILQSVMLAAIFTVIEIGGLFFVIYYGFSIKPDLLADIGRLIPPLEMGAWGGIVSAGLLAFFAFVGFEDIANVAEEVKNPRKNMPRAIIFTLIAATALYLAVVSVVILIVPMDRLSQSVAPLALVFENASDTTKGAFNIIAVIATINGVLIQMIMASRVLYGLAKQGRLPKQLAIINKKTHTPIIATAIVVAIILVLALFLPIAQLAQMTSQIVLVVFMLVNLSLIGLNYSGSHQKKKYLKCHYGCPC
ncbi:MAG: amino acid permease [Devosiaceae bacterium]|nr:amino acid permease [Devosiaceae bacterium]